MRIVRGRHDLRAPGDVSRLASPARDLGIGDMFGRERLFRKSISAELRTYMATDRREKTIVTDQFHAIMYGSRCCGEQDQQVEETWFPETVR